MTDTPMPWVSPTYSSQATLLYLSSFSLLQKLSIHGSMYTLPSLPSLTLPPSPPLSHRGPCMLLSFSHMRSSRWYFSRKGTYRSTQPCRSSTEPSRSPIQASDSWSTVLAIVSSSSATACREKRYQGLGEKKGAVRMSEK